MQPADQKGCKMIKAAFVKDTFPYFITTLNVFDNVVHIYPLVEDLISKMILKFNNFVAYLQISGLKAKLVRFFKGKKRWISMSLLMLKTEGYGKNFQIII